MGLTPENLRRLTPEEIRQRYGPTREEVNEAAEDAYYAQLGEEIERHPIGRPRKRRGS